MVVFLLTISSSINPLYGSHGFFYGLIMDPLTETRFGLFSVPRDLEIDNTNLMHVFLSS